MPVTVACPCCAAKLRAPDAAAGGKFKCPKCGGVLSVPAAEEAADVATFAVRAENPQSPPSSRGPREDEDGTPTSRRRRDEDDDDLRRRKSRRRRDRESTRQGGLQKLL